MKPITWLTLGAVFIILAAVGGWGFYFYTRSQMGAEAEASSTASPVVSGCGDGTCPLPDSREDGTPVGEGGTTAEVQELQELYQARIEAGEVAVGRDQSLEVDSVQVEGSWGVVRSLLEYQLDDGTAPSESRVALVFKKDGEWQFAEQGTDKFGEWLELIPESLVPAEMKAYLRGD